MRKVGGGNENTAWSEPTPPGLGTHKRNNSTNVEVLAKESKSATQR